MGRNTRKAIARPQAQKGGGNLKARKSADRERDQRGK